MTGTPKVFPELSEAYVSSAPYFICIIPPSPQISPMKCFLSLGPFCRGRIEAHASSHLPELPLSFRVTMSCLPPPHERPKLGLCSGDATSRCLLTKTFLGEEYYRKVIQGTHCPALRPQNSDCGAGRTRRSPASACFILASAEGPSWEGVLANDRTKWSGCSNCQHI